MIKTLSGVIKTLSGVIKTVYIYDFHSRISILYMDKFYTDNIAIDLSYCVTTINISIAI